VQRKLPEAYKLFGAIIPLPITTIALILTIFYVTSVFSAIKRRRVSKKYYVLLINRAIGDLLCCVTFIWFSVYLLRTKDLKSCKAFCSREVAGVWEMIFTSSLWSSMVSYVSISVLKLYAVYKPLEIQFSNCILLLQVPQQIPGFIPDI
uniref:7TM_GPCR_Srx domain-containing protein n=1 Tax=Syphacia muris TaxID=451379 RepID=A0A0N5AHK9_9BILA